MEQEQSGPVIDLRDRPSEEWIEKYSTPTYELVSAYQACMERLRHETDPRECDRLESERSWIFTGIIDIHQPSISHEIRRRMPQAQSFQRDELIAAAYVGLLEATERASLEMEPGQLNAFLLTRSKLAIVDWLRASRWDGSRASRRMREEIKKVKKAEETAHLFEGTIAEQAGMSEDRYRHVIHESYVSETIALESLLGGNNYDQLLVLRNPNETVETLIDDLLVLLEKPEFDDRERDIFNLYFRQGLNLQEIGKLCGDVTESRISQLLSKMYKKLHRAYWELYTEV
jgi:RNA polymerase sigma factor (sigma-70 family)